MRSSEHLENGLLILFLDDEASHSQCEIVTTHLAVCEACRRKRDEFLQLSRRIERSVAAIGANSAAGERESLAAAMAVPKTVPAKQHAGLRRLGWGLAMAASVAGVLWLGPHVSHLTTDTPGTAARAQLASFDINGENFIALPYSNPELPLNAPRIVEMQVPVASLESAGIVFTPAGSQADDRMVVANVVLGIDGQPLGLHVLSAE